jgi:arabinofuranosyltransferase
MASKKPQKKTSPQKRSSANIKAAGTDTIKIGLGIAVLGAIIMFYLSKSFNFIQDDSFITYRYVKNFTEGNGLVFNIGERVEGYTCFLWVIVLAGVKKMGFEFISASQTLGIISSMLTLLFTYLISAKIFPKNKDTFYNLSFSLIAVILLAVNGSNAYWAVSGMETGLFGLLLTAGIFLYLKENKTPSSSIPYSSVLFLLAAMTRPEGNLVFAVTVIHKIIITFKSSAPGGDARMKLLLSKNNMIWLGLYLVPAVIFMIWRYSYYGYLFPNTFYAKTGSSLVYFRSGLDYFWEFAKSYGGYGVLITLTLVTLRSKERFYDYLYLLMIFFVFSLYVIYVGGDVLRPNRFFVPILPAFYILVQEGLSEFLSAFDKKKAFAYGGIVGLIFAIGFSYYTYKNEFEQIKKYSELENGLVEKMKITAAWLKNKQTLSGRPLVVGATTIGAISYYSEVVLIDMLGLTDKEVAHNPQPIAEISSGDIGWKERNYNVDYVLSRKPDYIYFSTGIKPSAYAERGLFTSAEFMKYYYPFYFSLKEYNFTDIIYKRKSDEDAGKTAVLPPNPNYKKSFVNLYNQAMNTQKDKSKTQEAINLFQQAANDGPPAWGTPYQMIGDIYMQQKNNEKAFENYKKAVELDDYNVMAHYGLYQFYVQNKDTAKAMLSIEKIRKYTPELLQ